MTTINLYQNPSESENKKSFLGNNSGLFFSLGVLALTVAAIFAIRFFVGKVNNENLQLDNQIAEQSQALAGVSSLQRIVDLQTRVTQIKDRLRIANNTTGISKNTDPLGFLEKDIRPDAQVTSFAVNGNKVKVTFVTNNYNVAAGQILSFKKSTNFSNAALANIVRSDKNVSVDMTMDLKNSK